ncbi:MAG: AAA family ATPase [Bacillota bacterium]|nr:AAA family ATPase [Bacillota bacterium]
MAGAQALWSDSSAILAQVEAGSLSAAQALAALRSCAEGAENEAEARQARVKAVLEELDALVGLREVKHLVREIAALIEVQRWRAKEGLVSEPVGLHMIFRGNPGTGKTSVARILGRLFKEMGVLPKGHLVEVERADLVGEYIGHTAQKTREQIRRALGGILFVDEAYSLARGGEKDFGKEAIDTLVKAMEDHRNELVLILAGYTSEMERFLRVNPGLLSRFPIHLDFPDYTIAELMQIAELMVRRRQYRLEPEARVKLQELLWEVFRRRDQSFGNARLVRNIIERAIRLQALRLVKRGGAVDRQELMALRAEDLRL